MAMTEKTNTQHYDGVGATFDDPGPSVVQAPSFGGSIQFEDEEPDLHWKSYFIVLAAGFWYAATLSILLATGFWLAQIEGDIGGSAKGLWLSQAYNVVNAALGPIFGQLGDTCGRRYIMIGGLAFGMAGAAIIATAKSMDVAIVGSALYGINWALVGNAFAIASESVTRRWRPRAQSFMNAAGSTGIILAVFAGAGFIINEPGGLAGWRSTFWFAFAMMGTSLVLFAAFYFPASPPNPRNLSITQRILATDFVGSFGLATGIAVLLLGLIWGGNTYTWKSAPVLVTVILGILILIAFGLHQRFIKKDGLLHHDMFGKRNVQVACYGMAIEGFIYIVFNQYFGVVTGVLYEPRTLLLATRFSAFLFGNIFGSLFVQFIATRWKRVNELLYFGYTMFLIGCCMLAACKVGTSSLSIAAAVIMGFGFSAPIAMLIAVAQLAAPNHIGLISALLITARSFGGAVGVAICSAVFTTKLSSALPSYIAEAALAAGLPASSLPAFVEGLATNDLPLAESAPGVTPEILGAGGAAALEAYAYSFKYIWIIIIPFVVVALVSCFFLKPIAKEMNQLVDRPVEAIHHDHAIDEEKRAEAIRNKKALNSQVAGTGPMSNEQTYEEK